MKKITFILAILVVVSCTSNTIYKEPKDLIPKDTMVSLLADLLIATSAKSQKNKNLQRKINYMPLVYDRYKIDSVRFKISNKYYMSKIDEYEEIFKKVKENLKTLQDKYQNEKKQKDSINRLNKKKKRSIKNKDSIKLRKDITKIKEKFLKGKKRKTMKPTLVKNSLKVIKE